VRSLLTVKEAVAITGGLSDPDKLPGYAYNIPAYRCLLGSALRRTPGSVCSGCYAHAGRYVFPVVKAAMERRFKALMHDRWEEGMIFLISRYARTKGFNHFRWHDSGDLQGAWHLSKIAAVCKGTPEVDHWLPTRECSIVREFGEDVPDNLVIRLSATMIDGKTKDIGLPISSVHRDPTSYPDAFICTAPGNHNKCGSCRACWSPAVRHVSYRYH
jgi:hypothetical protein